MADTAGGLAQTIFDSSDFPGWGRFPDLIDGFIEERPGFAVLDVGSRPAWWLLSHRFLGWLRLNFWV